MASHNPNTKYGRRKNREELNRKYNAMSKEEKDEFDFGVGCLQFAFFIIVIAVCLVIVALGGKIK